MTDQTLATALNGALEAADAELAQARAEAKERHPAGKAQPQKFTLEIELGRETMMTGVDVSEALAEVAGDLFVGTIFGDSGSIRDAYGNTVGSWEVK